MAGRAKPLSYLSELQMALKLKGRERFTQELGLLQHLAFCSSLGMILRRTIGKVVVKVDVLGERGAFSFVLTENQS